MKKKTKKKRIANAILNVKYRMIRLITTKLKRKKVPCISLFSQPSLPRKRTNNIKPIKGEMYFSPSFQLWSIYRSLGTNITINIPNVERDWSNDSYY